MTEVHYDAKELSLRLKTKDGREGVYSLEDGKLYKNASDFRKSWEKDSTKIVAGILAPEDNSSSPRKKLYRVNGPKAVIRDNKSSLVSYVGREDHPMIEDKVYSQP